MSKIFKFTVYYDKKEAGVYIFQGGPLSSEKIESKEDAFNFGYLFFSTGRMLCQKPNIDTKITFSVEEVKIQKTAFQEWELTQDRYYDEGCDSCAYNKRLEGWNAAIDAICNKLTIDGYLSIPGELSEFKEK